MSEVVYGAHLTERCDSNSVDEHHGSAVDDDVTDVDTVGDIFIWTSLHCLDVRQILHVLLGIREDGLWYLFYNKQLSNMNINPLSHALFCNIAWNLMLPFGNSQQCHVES